MSCVLVEQIMLPFAGSDLNAISLGGLVSAAQERIADAFIISLAGFAAVVAGGELWKMKLGIGVRRTVSSVLDILPRQSWLLMSSRLLLIIQAGFCLLAQLAIVAFYFKNRGFGFDLRSYTFEEPALRPIALFISNYSIIIASHCLARYMDTKEKVLLTCTLLLSVGLLFFGSRGNVVEVYFAVMLCYLVKLGRRLRLGRLIAIIVLVLFVVLYLGALRAGIYSVTLFVAGAALALLYGNTFSDLRDFALLLSFWNGHFWLGKTYFAAAAAFVPRFLSSYRETWSIGVVTATMVGFDPKVHPGLRPGIFGESYFNFGYLGVVMMGLMVGIVVRKVDLEVKKAVGSPRPSIAKAFSYTVLLSVISNLEISAGVASIYMLLLVFGIAAVGRYLVAGLSVLYIPKGTTGLQDGGHSLGA
jgi:oligosaccharide repeat unit polymerase